MKRQTIVRSTTTILVGAGCAACCAAPLAALGGVVFGIGNGLLGGPLLLTVVVGSIGTGAFAVIRRRRAANVTCTTDYASARRTHDTR